MQSDKVKRFMQLAGQQLNNDPREVSEEFKKLAAQLLLSETLEYLIKGLKVSIKVNGEVLTQYDDLEYSVIDQDVDLEEMLDGLADVAYTMYWNMLAFGTKLEEGFDLVCDNNLQKFVHLPDWSGDEGPLDQSVWDLGKGITWPEAVTQVLVIKVDGTYYAVGKDQNSKVMKPSSFNPVDLSSLL